MQTVCCVEIDATPKRVFHWLEDPECVMQWISNLVENQPLHETPHKVDTTFRRVVDENGQRIEIQGRITQYEPDRLLGVHLVGRGFEVEAEYHLEEIAGRTRLTQIADVRFRGLMRIIALATGPLLKRSAVQKLHKDFAVLKRLCERVSAS